jgi:hypothetical protein
MLSADGKQFVCTRCREVKPVLTGCTPGYALERHGNLVCFACCADVDRDDMVRTGKAALYLVRKDNPGHTGQAPYSVWEVTNWPGSLRFACGTPRKGFHNMARTRYDVWFTGPDGRDWHGVQYGDNTKIVHCKRVKG